MSVVGAFFAVLVGVLTSTVGSFVAQATPALGGELAPYASAGGASVAVGGIVYIARLMATGRLVARDPAVEAEALRKIAESNGQLVVEGHARETEYLQLLRDRYARDHRGDMQK